MSAVPAVGFFVSVSCHWRYPIGRSCHHEDFAQFAQYAGDLRDQAHHQGSTFEPIWEGWESLLDVENMV